MNELFVLYRKFASYNKKSRYKNESHKSVVYVKQPAAMNIASSTGANKSKRSSI